VKSFLVNTFTGINIPAQPHRRIFNAAKIAKLANKTEEVAIILACDALKII
jgi:hypothetical protein